MILPTTLIRVLSIYREIDCALGIWFKLFIVSHGIALTQSDRCQAMRVQVTTVLGIRNHTRTAALTGLFQKLKTFLNRFFVLTSDMSVTGT